jgi:N-acetylglucosaminyldiphosphoundecaprenol N-acetyl-beta-D-mannosaminyltransferase
MTAPSLPAGEPVQRVGGVAFRAATPSEATGWIVDAARANEGRHVHLLNAYSLALADRDPSFRGVISGDAINFPDGRPLSWASRLQRHDPGLQQVRGPGLFLHVLEAGRAAGVRHYLLGSTPEVLDLLRGRIETDFPGVLLVGCESPPFREVSAEELAERDRRIVDSGADIVWVGLGTPKQDFEAQRIAATLPVMAVAVGAAFDFAAGTVKEAPAWMSPVGLEWAYRLATEPKRLWRRYVFGNPRFIRAVIRHWRDT